MSQKITLQSLNTLGFFRKQKYFHHSGIRISTCIRFRIPHQFLHNYVALSDAGKPYCKQQVSQMLSLKQNSLQHVKSLSRKF